ncbi:MAG: hypothetical protein NC078_04975 [Ruminococcus sp.]|nr:hypothetical protein [Ruminococcus sp.]
MSVAFDLLFYLLLSLGISFSAASVGQTVSDAYNAGDIVFPSVEAHQEFDSYFNAYDLVGNTVITDDMVKGTLPSSFSTSDIANARVDVQQWMLSNQNNVKYVAADTDCSFSLDGQLYVSFDFVDRGGSEPGVYDINVNFYENADDDVPFYSRFLSTYSNPGNEYPVPYWNFNNLYVKDGYLYFSYSKVGYDWRGRYVVDSSSKAYLSASVTSKLDGDVSADKVTPIEDLIAPVVGSAIIGGITYDLNPDGTVDVDGVGYTVNPDGSITIDGQKYYPQINPAAYDDTALRNLLDEILDRLDDIEDELKFEDDIADELEFPAVSYDGLMSEFLLDSRITQVFPFCLPFDFVRGVKLFSAEPETPVFKYSFKIPSIGAYKGDTVEIVIDFSPFEKLSVICRWVSTIAFMFTLIMITPKIVKGAG